MGALPLLLEAVLAKSHGEGDSRFDVERKAGKVVFVKVGV